MNEIGFILKSKLFPFGTTVIVPDKGTKLEFEDLGRGPDSEEAHFDERGALVIPSGGSVRVNFKIRGREFSLKIDDYRERTGHTPGTRITGTLKFKLDIDKPRQIIPGYGTFSYEED